MVDNVTPNTESETMYSNAGANPARDYAEVTPSDTVDLPFVARALRVGTGGDVAVINFRGSSVTFSNVQDGETLPAWVRRVMATGTTASNIIAYHG